MQYVHHSNIVINEITAILSQRQCTRRPPHRCPQIATANGIGKSSLGAICHPWAAPCHCHWSHCGPHRAPQPNDPEASDSTVITGKEYLGIIDTPFHPSKNVAQHVRSDRVDALRRTHLSLDRTTDNSSIRRCTKVRPGRTTVAVCYRCPRRDSTVCMPFS